MTTRAACASTAWNTATTWATVDATSFSNSETANTVLTTSYVESSAFTPGAITIDGLAVKIASRPGSTGTMSLRLAIATVTVPGTEITVNVSDLPTATATTGTTTPVGTAEGGWFFVKFAAPVLLVAATNYTLSAKTSSSTQVNLWSTATSNWSRYLRTTTTGNMAGGDDAIITGEWTAAATVTARSVSMDETATTDYGGNSTSQVTPSLAICKSGTLTFGTAIAANLRQSGYVIVYNGGTLNIGSSGSEVARGSSAVLQFDCAADGDFGLVARIGSTVNTAGLSRTSGKNVVQTLLNADAAGGATSITIVDDTGWLSGDVVCLAPTTQTSTQFESKALTGNATATTAAITALANAHSGTSPTQGEVGLLTRNVQITSVTANIVTFFYVATTATVNTSWTDYRYIGTNATGKRGVEINTTTGSFTSSFCSFRDTDTCAIYILGSTSNNITIQDFVIYNNSVATGANGALNVSAQTSGTWTINRGLVIGAANASLGLGGVILVDVGGTFTNVSISGIPVSVTGAGIVVSENAPLGTFSGLTSHSNAGAGLNSTGSVFPSGTITTFNAWRNATFGAQNLGGCAIANSLTFVTSNFFGNATAGFNIVPGSGVANWQNIVFDTCTFNGDTTFAQGDSFRIATIASGYIRLFSCSLSVVAGIKTKCTNDINASSLSSIPVFLADNSIINGTNIYASVSTLLMNGVAFLQAQNFGQVSNDNRSYFPNGTTVAGVIQSNSTTVYSPNVLSEQITPASATFKFLSQSIFVECTSGKAATPIVQVQKNGTYNGNAARLIVKRQDSIGVTVDTVLDTLTVGANTWEGLTGTTVTATQNGVFEFVIDCDGTAGSVFVGDATATTA